MHSAQVHAIASWTRLDHEAHSTGCKCDKAQEQTRSAPGNQCDCASSRRKPGVVLQVVVVVLLLLVQTVLGYARILQNRSGKCGIKGG